MTYKNSDSFNRDLKRNVYINKIKDVSTFIAFINSIYKSIIGKNTLTECFYKFDRVLSVKIIKVAKTCMDFHIYINSAKTNHQMYLEDLYTLLYLFFIGIEVSGVKVEKMENKFHITLNVEFKIGETHNVLIKDVLLRIKHIKKIRRLR